MAVRGYLSPLRGDEIDINTMLQRRLSRAAHERDNADDYYKQQSAQLKRRSEQRAGAKNELIQKPGWLAQEMAGLDKRYKDRRGSASRWMNRMTSQLAQHKNAGTGKNKVRGTSKSSGFGQKYDANPFGQGRGVNNPKPFVRDETGNTTF